jgi:hypothetical protein
MKNSLILDSLDVKIGIVGSYIEIEQIFIMVRAITSLSWCWFSIKNLDKIVPIMKIWHDDPKCL